MYHSKQDISNIKQSSVVWATVSLWKTTSDDQILDLHSPVINHKTFCELKLHSQPIFQKREINQLGLSDNQLSTEIMSHTYE